MDTQMDGSPTRQELTQTESPADTKDVKRAPSLTTRAVCGKSSASVPRRSVTSARYITDGRETALKLTNHCSPSVAVKKKRKMLKTKPVRNSLYAQWC
ncbi:uncharacterized protein LOC123506071 isoform X4 [Portunus trituberculatus]|uniref:uncharacterized protein LOC123506071 isoform X4 n=1 Tax=Portunus trituberculatus TaxID=210409 RepID=UPI001E1CBAC8|nr:uncharacterized protein LOC123506071 isoform X4 [Portunus trituberculatus]XP_045113863.1 uncharacterized protein LOC123506071 isoform X4 [Portunus trituberculatus]